MRSSSIAGAVVLIALFVAYSSACGGKAVATGSSEPLADASPIAKSAPACPDVDPKNGTACTQDGLLCEYGDDYNPLCNVTRVCSRDRWAQPIHSGRATCPTAARVIPPNPPDCAVDVASTPAGACSSKSTCTYDGAICTCGVSCSNYPIRQPDCDADAGVTTNCCDTTKVTWNCFEGPKQCPTPRPRIGAACTTEDSSCAIDEPAECGQTVMQCDKGVWNVSNTECAVSTARAKREIAYVDADQADRLHAELMSVRLATYRYKAGDDARHLGFIIEDMPAESPAVLPTRDRVDLYAYTSMAVASLQHQQKEIDAMKAHIERLERENASMRTRDKAPAR